MSIQGITPVIAGLLKRLQDDLPAAVDLVNQESTDGTVIEQPKSLVDYVPPIEILVDWPTIAVAEGPGRFEDDTGFEATGVNELHVVVFLSNADQGQLARQLRLYRLAVARTVLEGRIIPSADGSGNAAWGVTLNRFDPGPTLGEVNGGSVTSYLSHTSIVLTARSDEV